MKSKRGTPTRWQCLFRIILLSKDTTGWGFSTGLSPFTDVVWGERGDPNILAIESVPHIGFVKLKLLMTEVSVLVSLSGTETPPMFRWI